MNKPDDAPVPDYRPYGWRARLGLIVPTTNTVNEAEWARMAPEVLRKPRWLTTFARSGKVAGSLSDCP